MAVNIQELQYRPGIEQVGIMPQPDHFGAFAFDKALFNTMSLVNRDPNFAVNQELAARTLDLARVYVKKRDPSTFIVDHKNLREVGTPIVRTVLGNEDKVLEIIDDEEYLGVTAEFVLELASLGEATDAILDTVTEVTAKAPDEALHNFRELLLEPIEEAAPPSQVTQDQEEVINEPVTLTSVVNTVLDELATGNFSGQISAQRIIEAFPEIRRDLTRLDRTRGSDGRMIVDVGAVADLLVAKRGKDLNAAPKARKQEIKTAMKKRDDETKKQRGGDIYDRSSIR